MSRTPTAVTEEIFDYILSHYSAEDDFLKQLLADADKYEIPPICISPEQGRFLQFMLKSINAKYVLEIGSLAGYSAIMMARALPQDGKLIAVEINPDYSDFIRMKAYEAGLQNIIEVVNADARDFLAGYKPDFEFDFAFVDADKLAYTYYFETLAPLLRKGGIFSADNALGFGEIAREVPLDNDIEEVKAIQQLNKALSEHPGFESCLVPVGDGMAMGVKL